MRYSKISWAASFDFPLKCTKAANVNHDILFPLCPEDASPLTRPLASLGGFLCFDSHLLTHRSKNNDIYRR